MLRVQGSLSLNDTWLHPYNQKPRLQLTCSDKHQPEKLTNSPSYNAVYCEEILIMTRKIIFIMAALLIVQPFLFGQDSGDVITEKEATRIIHFLAADSLKGRGNGRTELLKAGLFIGDEFKETGYKCFRERRLLYAIPTLWRK